MSDMFCFQCEQTQNQVHVSVKQVCAANRRILPNYRMN